MKSKLVFLLLISAAILTSCETESGTNGSESTSGTSSHNAGKNCLGCHSFKLAGSVYNEAISATIKGADVKITSEADGAGTVLATLTSDKTGNFYTSSSVNFSSGVYVNITGTSGTVKYMNSAITSGACNSCHNGSNTTKVWVP